MIGIQILFLLFSCFSRDSSSYDAQVIGKWPDKWNNDMEVSIGRNGGRMPESWEITIKNDSAWYKRSFAGSVTAVRAKLSQAQLDSIAFVVNSAAPHKIKMEKHAIIHDKGTTYIRLRYKDQVLSLEESATKSLSLKGRKNFNKIYDTVWSIVQRETQKLQLKVTLEIHCVQPGNYWCYFQQGSTSLGQLGCPDSARTNTVKVFPGEQTFYGYVFQSANGRYKYPQKTWPFDPVSFSIQKDTVLKFALMDSVLTLTN
jgi:hypothetical protein